VRWLAVLDTAMLMITHEGIDQREAWDVLRRRWPDLVTKSLEYEEPAVATSSIDAADLRRRHRGVESLGIVIMPQHDRQAIMLLVFEPRLFSRRICPAESHCQS
jgi:hypothetical protein